MKLYPYQLKIGRADSPGVSVAGFGRTAQTNFLQIFNMMLKSVKKLAHRMVFPVKGGDILSARLPVKPAETGNSDSAGRSNKGEEFLNLPAASVMPVPLENLNISEENNTNVRLSPEKTIDIVKTVKNSPQSYPDRNAGIQKSTVSPEFSGKQISTQNDLSEAGTFEDNSGHEKSVAGAAQPGLVEENTAENTGHSGNAQILNPALGNSEVITQRESVHNPVQNKQIADLSKGPETLSAPVSRSESSSSRSIEKTKVQTADSPLAAKTAENYGKFRRIIYRIFSRKQAGNDIITSDESEKAGKVNTGQFIKGNVPGEAKVNISAKDPLLSGKAGKIISAESQTLLSSVKNPVAAKPPEARFSSSLKQSLIPENDIQSAATYKQVTSFSEQRSATSQNVRSFEQNARFDEIKDNGEYIQDTESRSHNRSDDDFRSFSNPAHDFRSGPKKAGQIMRFNGVKEENIAAKTEEQDKVNPGNRISGGIASAAGKTKEITPNVMTREKAPIVPEKPPATDEFPEQITRSAINRAAADAENIRVPETITRVSLIQKVTQFIEQSAQSGIKRQFSLQLKTDENELVEMRFVRENRQNRGKIWVSSESMAQHLQRNLSVIQDNLLQKGIQFAELTVQLHNSDDFRSGEKNMNSRRANKKEERNLRTVESKQQQATVRTAYKYGYNTVEFIA